MAPPSAAPSASEASRHALGPLMTEGQLGALIESISEVTGDFPSDNYVSNETSYLDVAPVLRGPKFQGKAYVGVGPEQNFTYAALMHAPVVFVVDIRRQNMLEHLVFRSCFERAETRQKFAACLISRPLPDQPAERGKAMTWDEIADSLGASASSQELADKTVGETVRLMERLGWTVNKGDRRSVEKVVRSFRDKGFGLTYEMVGSGRKYPTWRTIAGTRDPEGNQTGFLGNEEYYQYIRDLEMANRVVPVVGDFGGQKALKAVGAELKARGFVLGVFYTSNVEQYLFEPGTYAKFADNVRTMPGDGESHFVRVWFDQGRKHPDQKPGHRTTTLAMPLAPWLDRAASKPYRSYWDVATEK